MPKPFVSRADRTTPAHDGATDLATFGALPVALIGAPALAENGRMTASPAARIAFAPAARETNGEHGDHSAALPASETQMLAPPPAGGAIAAPIVATSSGAGDVHATPAAVAPTFSGIVTFVPIPHGSGAVAKVAPVAADNPHTTGTAAPAAITAGDSIESMHASVAALQEALNMLAERLPPAPGAVTANHLADAATATLDGVSATVDHLGDSTGALIASVTETLDHVVGGAPDVGGIASAASATLSHVADLTSGIAPAVSGVVAPAEATFGHVLAAVPDVGTAVAAATTTLGDIADSVTSAAAPALDHIAGGDPVGGIATLVGMVSAADAFNLHDAGSDAGAMLAPALGIAGSVDLLADVVPHEALLGVGDHHGDGFAGIDLHDGLFGHG